MIHIREELEELLKKYPDPEEGEAGIAAFRRNKETMAALPRFAVVTDNRDPLGLGRVRATCDSLASGALTDWLPVAGAGRGEDGSGFWQVPDPGDQALLVFPGGEADSPIVLGGVFGEAAKPPEIRTDKAEESFVWQTKNHRVEIRDTREGESLVISTGDGSMRYSAFADGNAELVNELGDIELSCKKLTISTEADLCIGADKKLSLCAGAVALKSTRKTELSCGGDFGLKGKTIKIEGSGGASACGKKMAKAGDTVMGFDVHKTEVPSGKGTSTVLLPHPFIGKLADKLSANVRVGAAAAATLGSVARHNDAQHNRLPGTVSFTAPPKKEGEVSGGTAKTVKINGKEAAVIGSTVSTCSDTGQKDHSVVMPG